uniref:Uncharacterized protein n=1 Tax=Panagrolaimus sp. JU765 TaxID=591449 RepID=A0AC34R3Q3_9BILA
MSTQQRRVRATDRLRLMEEQLRQEQARVTALTGNLEEVRLQLNNNIQRHIGQISFVSALLKEQNSLIMTQRINLDRLRKQLRRQDRSTSP